MIPQTSPHDLKTDLGRAADLSDLLERALSHAARHFSAKQAVLYSRCEDVGSYHLEFCCGTSPFELRDRFSLDTPGGSGELEAKVAQSRGVVTQQLFIRGLPWLRVGIPLFQHVSGQMSHEPTRAVDGILCLCMQSANVPDEQHLDKFATAVALELGEIRLLSQLRYSKYQMLGELIANRNYLTHKNELVASLSEAIAAQLGLNTRETEEIKIAAYVRDVGLQCIAHDFVNEPRELTAQERKQLQHVPSLSTEVIKKAHLPARIISAVHSYRERFDGRGYPKGIYGKEIPLGGRIIAVAETFVAITSARPYRKARTPVDAIAEVFDMAGIQFDPEVTSCLPIALIRVQSGR